MILIRRRLLKWVQQINQLFGLISFYIFMNSASNVWFASSFRDTTLEALKREVEDARYNNERLVNEVYLSFNTSSAMYNMLVMKRIAEVYATY